MQTLLQDILWFQVDKAFQIHFRLLASDNGAFRDTAERPSAQSTSMNILHDKQQMEDI